MSGRAANRAHDVAIYSPASSVFFGGRGRVTVGEREFAAGEKGVAAGGGAELQMAQLSRGLAARGLRTALICWPVHDPAPVDGPSPDLVSRGEYAGDRRGGRLAEAVRIWRAMAAADAAAYVFRGAGPQLFVASVFCRLHRRKLVFSAATDLDFDFERSDRGRAQLAMTRMAVPRADLIVAQRGQQAELATADDLGPVEVIQSFAEPAEASEAKPEAFLWIGRLVDYKRPLEYVRLAASIGEARFRMVWFPTDETQRELIDQLHDVAAPLGNLELIDQTPRPELLDLIGRAVAVVSTSEAEGMPNTFLEAWARGVPVLSLDYDPDGRIAELGLGLVADSEAALARAAESLWRDRELRDRLGKQGREHVRSFHSPDAVADRWAEVLRPLLEKR
jgi:glycosyltransferase involved in cell wall biosynthesis